MRDRIEKVSQGHRQGVILALISAVRIAVLWY